MDTLNYQAIITISLPGTGKKGTASLTLRPSDMVGGNQDAKPLRDCTLAELQQFADSWEAEVWETYQDIKLGHLVDEKEAQVEMARLHKADEPPLTMEEWLEQSLVLPAETAAEGEGVETAATETAAGKAQATVEDEAAAPTMPAVDEDSPTPATEEAEETAVETPALPQPPVLKPEAAQETVQEPQPPTLKPEVAPEIVEDVESQPALEEAPAGEGEEAEPQPVSEEVPAGEREEEVEPVVPQKSEPDSEEEVHITIAESTLVHEEREMPAGMPSADTIIPSKARVRVAGRRHPPGHSTWAAVDILIDEPALRAAQAHALSSPNREVAGVLVGPSPEKQPDGRYVVHAIDTIIAKYTVMQGASVTYTPESWRYMSDKLSERYPDESAVIVGWYHTHPGFGIFLSGMDQFIHQNFFTQIWHIALVLDPLARTSGFFCWDRNKTRVSRYDFSWPAWAAGSW